MLLAGIVGCSKTAEADYNTLEYCGGLAYTSSLVPSHLLLLLNKFFVSLGYIKRMGGYVVEQEPLFNTGYYGYILVLFFSQFMPILRAIH